MKENNSNDYSGPHYILKPQLLKDGDIILEKGYEWYSDEIGKRTNSEYSHAMIYASGTIVEATQEGGVYSRIPNRSTVREKNHFKVLRLKEPLDEINTELLCIHARRLSGSKYSIVEAIASGLPKIIRASNTDTGKQFCSRLVAQCYHYVGIDLVPNINFCSPGDIERSELLYEVTGMTELASAEQVAHAHEHSYHHDHVKSSVSYTDLALEILLKHKIKTIGTINGEILITTISDISRAMHQNKDNGKLDEELSEAMVSSGFHEERNMDKLKNPYRYDNKEFKKHIEEKSNGHLPIIIQILQADLHENCASLKARISNYIAAKGNSNMGLKFTELELSACAALLKGILDRLITIEFYTSDKKSIREFYDINLTCQKEIKEIRHFAPDL